MSTRSQTGVGSFFGPVLEAVDAQQARATCRDVVYAVSREKGVSPRRVRSAVSALVERGDLRYVVEGGVGFLEKNYAGRVRISRRVFLVSQSETGCEPEPGCVAIRFLPGAAFGDCRHPTTRLSVRAVDFLAGMLGEHACRNSLAVDIGTGSGILALAAAALGIGRVVAIDIDPCALKEAAENVAINNLEERIDVSGKGLDRIEGPASVVMANLRPPTLRRISSGVLSILGPDGCVVLSGFREDEADFVAGCYSDVGPCLWKDVEKGWCCLVFGGRRLKRSSTGGFVPP